MVVEVLVVDLGLPDPLTTRLRLRHQLVIQKEPVTSPSRVELNLWHLLS